MIKRTLDIVIALLALVLLSPLILAITLTILITMGSPVLFSQGRPGQNKSPFKLIKFRTMKIMISSDGNPLPDNKRITPFGCFLRNSSLDELPELWNVLKGNMSLVGPRPLLMEYLPLYTEKQRRRHEVKPGITGWAQINGRNAISWEEKFNLDIWYIDNHSTWLDIKILFLTIKKVILHEGITAEGHATTEKFTGSQ